MTSSIAWLNVTSSDTSLAMISASTRIAVLDLRVAAFVGEQPSQDFFSNRMFGGIQRAVIASLKDSSQPWRKAF
jgi:hypothetical protein